MSGDDAALSDFGDRFPDATKAERAVAAQVSRHAPSLMSLVLADPHIVRDVLARPLEQGEGYDGIRANLLAELSEESDELQLQRVLRRQRHRSLLRVALREVMRLADVDETGAELSALASACLDVAVEKVRAMMVSRHGEPRTPEGERVPLVALGMGKLGGWELNLGSDIDLIFFYGTDNAEVEDGSLSTHEYFSKLVRRVTRSLSEVTEDGFAFRVDLRLRPEGSRGPLVNSVASAERYYETFGRAWERGALLRARPVAGDLALGEELLEILRPFVFRRAVDPSIAASMHAMVARARRDLGADEERDLKLGRGGIRELEFFVQALQLVWGGLYPDLQVPGTIEAIKRLQSAGLLSDSEAKDLEAGWALLRRIEHRIQMMAGYQTHELPPNPDGLAESLGLHDAQRLRAELDPVRYRIRELFDSLVDEPSEPTHHGRLLDAIAEGASAPELAPIIQESLGFRDPTEAASHLYRAGGRARSPFSAPGQERHLGLASMLLEEVQQAADMDAALRNTVDLVTRLSDGYLKLLAQEPRLTRRLVGVFGASRMLSQAMVTRPEAFGELLAHGGCPEKDEIEQAHAQLVERSEGDVETFVEALRVVKRELTLRIGIAHVGSEIGNRETEELLTEVADQQLRSAAAFAWFEATAKWGSPTNDEGLAIVGLGKLGSRELGFSSDLDVLFLYGEDGDTVQGPSGRSVSHAELFTRVAQRTMRLLSQPAAQGAGYEVDTRLRPSGSRGLLVVSRGAFEKYHESRAEGWERLALIRSRVVVAPTDHAARDISAALERAAYHPLQDPATEARRLAELRGRLQHELARESARRYHPKLGFGGLVDVELATQWLQMTHANDRDLRHRHTLDALDALHERGVMLDDDHALLRSGYEFFRGVGQALRLHDDSLEAVVSPLGPRATAAARRLRLRARDGMSAEEVLQSSWQRHAEAVRSIFDRVVAPVNAPAPWSGKGTT